MESFDSIENASFLSLFREEGFPASYPNGPSFPDVDYSLIRIFSLFLCFWLIFLFISPGYPGRERWFYICRITIFLTVPLFIIFCYYAPYWESASADILNKPRFSSVPKMRASVGLHIGLQGFNIKLRNLEIMKGSIKHSFSTLENDDLPSYNEKFSWNWATKEFRRPKLSEETGHLMDQYRLSVNKGLPIPFLWILNYFTIDGEEYRFTRFYQQASWYCHMILWFSLGCWLLSSFLFCIVVEFGSLLMLITGLSLIVVNMIWAFHTNPIPLEIPLLSPTEDKPLFLHPDYSWAYWINLTNGIFCLIMGTFIYLIDIKYPDLTAQFFGIDIIQNYDNFFREIDEDKKKLQHNQGDEFSASPQMTSSSSLKKDSNYVALRKKVTSNRLSRLHRMTQIREPTINNTSRQVLTTPKHTKKLPMPEPHYITPSTISVPVQPRVIGTTPGG